MRRRRFRKLRQVLFGVSAGVGFAVSAPALAATWHVDTSAPTNGNGNSWTTPFNNLQSALTNGSLADGDRIKVAQGVYKPHASDRNASFIINKKIIVQGGYAGIGTSNPDDHNIGAYVTVLSGDLSGNDGANFTNYSDNSYHVVTFANANLDDDTVLEGFTIRGGNASGDGGGIRMTFNAQPRILRCIIKENRSDANGGGASCGQAGPQFRHCTFQDNEADLAAEACTPKASPSFPTACFRTTPPNEAAASPPCAPHPSFWPIARCCTMNPQARPMTTTAAAEPISRVRERLSRG